MLESVKKIKELQPALVSFHRETGRIDNYTAYDHLQMSPQKEGWFLAFGSMDDTPVQLNPHWIEKVEQLEPKPNPFYVQTKKEPGHKDPSNI